MTGDFGVDSVDDFLEKCRSEPPNFIVSDRVQGEAEVEPFKWSDPQSSPPYDAKRAALMFVSKIIVDNTVHTADNQHVGDFRKNLFILSIAFAHELVHMFVGYMAGDERGTPPGVDDSYLSSTPSKGESGRAWEKSLFGGRFETYFDRKHQLPDKQAGAIQRVRNHRASVIDFVWMGKILDLRFEFPAKTLAGEVTVRPHSHISMESRRTPSKDDCLVDVVNNMGEFMDDLNKKPTFAVTSPELSEIMGMANDPDRVRLTRSGPGRT